MEEFFQEKHIDSKIWEAGFWKGLKFESYISDIVENLIFLSHIYNGVLFATEQKLTCTALFTTSSLGSVHILFKCAQNYLVGKLNAKPARQTMSLACLSSPHWKKSLLFLNSRLMLLINDLVQMRTKKDLKCLSMSFGSLVSVAFQKCVLLPL